MGGDHTCPVCQATFTRPQHVARHMRSHTGDRPYKCQYCGDQFARSDLLARHINKCHANEKPLPNTTTGTRRKGSAVASRATTSKQACDQCVQSSLPCDGSNPCSKCVSRKCRCTYVKFHRQTAPTGPGHRPPQPQSPSSSTSSLSGSIGPSRLPSHLDNFILAPPPSAPHASFTGADQMFNTPFTFNPAALAYPQNWTAADVSQFPFGMASEPDIAAKYRAQADLLRRAGPSILSNNSPTMLPGLYGTQHHQSPSSNWYPSWSESRTYPHLDDTKSFDGIARTHSLTTSEPTSFAPEFYGAGFIGSAYRPRRVSLDFSDSSSATSQSVPSSAASSNVHLPLAPHEMHDGRSEEMQTHDAHILQHQRSNSLPTSQLASLPGVAESSHPHPQHRVGEGGFSSAFGLMSIDDPNVLAGLSSDGVPFFSNLGMDVLPHSPNATPMPTRVQHPHPHQGRDRGMSLSVLPTVGLTKDSADTRELKDMWKTYMHSPLSGSGTAALDLSSSSQPLSLAQMPHSPSGQRRRMRVSSFPSVTPTVERGHPLMVNGGGHGEVDAGGNAVRTTMHGNPEDLRSYQAAVNARSASLKLNLVPRRKGTRPCLNGSLPRGVSAAASQADHQGISRPSSSSSTSSLAQVFTLPPHPQHHGHSHPSHAHAPAPGVVKPPPMQGASISLPSMSLSGLHSNSYLHSQGPGHSHSHPHSVILGSSTSLPFEPGSRASSVTSDGTGTGGSGSDGEAFRPSFKRYPSQTLVPATSKRALVERRGGAPKGVRVSKGTLKGEHREEGGEEMEDGEPMDVFECVGVSAGMGSPGSRPIAALPERAKRG
ncbi:hypothetical protein OG21DRAFT_1506440 [Imleria badia]|nr:hypothetical protein OG21DRAFT_1506440 [Imleria badia]